LEEYDRKIPDFNLEEVIEYITNKGNILYEVITQNTKREPINIYAQYGLDILTIVFLQLRYGLRISELLRATCRDIKDSHTFIVRGSKQSRYRLCELPYTHPALLQPCRCGRHYLFSVSYKQVWRCYNKLEITAPPRRGGSYRAVTHTGRIRFIAMINRLQFPPEAIRDIVGHKTINSQNYYLSRRS